MTASGSKAKIPLFERLQIESQSNCNRSCWFCPRTYDRSGKYLDGAGKSVMNQMPTEKILDLLDQAQALGFRERVSFHHFSEPLLDKCNIMLESLDERNRQRRQYREKIYGGLSGVPGISALYDHPKATPAGFYGRISLIESS